MNDCPNITARAFLSLPTVGDTDQTQAQVDMLLDFCKDKDMQAYDVFYSPDIVSSNLSDI